MKLLMRKELENFYNLRKGNPVGILGSVYATSAEAVGVSEVGNDYVVSVKHCDSENINVFVVSKEEIDDKGVMTFKGEDVELYVSTFISDFIVPKGKNEEYLIFLDPSMHKGFSTWLYSLDNDIYVTMTESGDAFIPNAQFGYTFDVRQWNNYLFYNRLTYIEGTKKIKLRLNHIIKGDTLIMKFLRSLSDSIYVRTFGEITELNEVAVIDPESLYNVISEVCCINVEEDEIFDDFIEHISDKPEYYNNIAITVYFDTEV